MKSFKYLFLAIVALFGCSISRAQCNISYSLSYAVTTGYAYDTANTHLNVHTSVISSGSASMAIAVQGTCPDSIRTQLQNAINHATHSLGAYNKIGTVGNWATGPALCASCWMSEENDQVYTSTLLPPAKPVTGVPNFGPQITFTHAEQVNCSVGGLVLSAAFIFDDFDFAGTASHTVGVPICIGPSCLQALTPWCYNTTQPTFNPTSLHYFQPFAPTPIVYGVGFCHREDSILGIGPWHCELGFYISVDPNPNGLKRFCTVLPPT